LSNSDDNVNRIRITPIRTDILFNAPSHIRNSLVQMKGLSVNTKELKVAETNMNFVKYNGALAYGWGGEIPLGKALQNIKNLQSEAFLTQAQSTNVTTLMNLVKKADTAPNPKDSIVPVGSKQFELFSITAQKDLK